LVVLQQHATGLSNTDKIFIHRGNADDTLVYSDISYNYNPNQWKRVCSEEKSSNGTG